MKGKQGLSVEGVVAARNKQPYVALFRDGERVGQLTMAEARNFAHDILTMCARTEADAMIYRFFAERDLPHEAAGAVMLDFRNFRAALDDEPVEKWAETPSGDPPAH